VGQMRIARRGNFLKWNARRMSIEIMREKGGKVRYKPDSRDEAKRNKRQRRRFPPQRDGLVAGRPEREGARL
jgi:hypothetical protein